MINDISRNCINLYSWMNEDFDIIILVDRAGMTDQKFEKFKEIAESACDHWFLPDEESSAYYSGNDYWLACNHPDALISVYAHYIKKGIPLPEKHGRLVDADALIAKCGDWYTEEGTEAGFIGSIKMLLEDAPTIVEAEGE